MPEVKIRLTPLDKQISVARGTSLIDVLHEFGVEFPCGGKGTCGKCKVRLLQGEIPLSQEHRSLLRRLGLARDCRLACKSTAESDLVLEVEQYEVMIQADESTFDFEARSAFGIAVDLGTTSLIAQLLDLSNAKVLAVETALNPQRRWGSDLISRVESALAGRPYTVFYGHVHSYLHEVRHGNDYIRLGTTGGVQNPDKAMAIDHVSMVTVSADGVDIANLRLSGIFDKTGHIPLNGEELCFEAAVCGGEWD